MPRKHYPVAVVNLLAAKCVVGGDGSSANEPSALPLSNKGTGVVPGSLAKPSFAWQVSTSSADIQKGGPAKPEIRASKSFQHGRQGKYCF